jgi:hypothetical protein
MAELFLCMVLNVMECLEWSCVYTSVPALQNSLSAADWLVGLVMFYYLTLLILSETSSHWPSKRKEVTKQGFCYKFYWCFDWSPNFGRKWSWPDRGIIPTYALRDCWKLWETSDWIASALVMLIRPLPNSFQGAAITPNCKTLFGQAMMQNVASQKCCVTYHCSFRLSTSERRREGKVCWMQWEHHFLGSVKYFAYKYARIREKQHHWIKFSTLVKGH